MNTLPAVKNPGCYRNVERTCLPSLRIFTLSDISVLGEPHHRCAHTVVLISRHSFRCELIWLRFYHCWLPLLPLISLYPLLLYLVSLQLLIYAYVFLALWWIGWPLKGPVLTQNIKHHVTSLQMLCDTQFPSRNPSFLD